MAEVAADAIGVVRRYVAELERNAVRVRAAILFGSRAKGTADEWSDFDVALVSDDFNGDWIHDREIVRQPALDVDCRIEAHVYRPEEFSPDDLFVKEILDTGIRVV